jgi:hypothetical protein
MVDENNATPEADATAESVVEGSETKAAPTPYDELKSFMEARDLKSPDDLTDFVENLGTTEQWKKQYGDSENKVGSLRQELEALRAQVQQQAYEPGYEQPVTNIKDVVGQEIRNVISEMQQQNIQAQMKYLTERNSLMKRPGWNDVQPHFDKAMSDPQVQYALQSGNLTQEKLYSTINERVLMSKVNTFVNQMPEGALKTPAPNTETSDRTLQPIPENEAKNQRMQKAVENQDVDALLKDLIPDNDPIVQF